jgi:hypothetical protein
VKDVGKVRWTEVGSTLAWGRRERIPFQIMTHQKLKQMWLVATIYDVHQHPRFHPRRMYVIYML